MIPEPEAPAPGGSGWLGNAAVYERHRRDCIDSAVRCEEAGDEERAGFWRQSAETWRGLRDDDQRRMQMQALNRRIHRRRYW